MTLSLVVIAIVAASIAWSHDSRRRYQLGGVWMGQLEGIQWISAHAPLDPEAKSALGSLQWVTINEDFKRLSGALGANQSSLASGVFEMINRDTAKFRLVFYAYAEGVSSPTEPQADQIKAIYVMDGTWHYTSADTAESQETLAIYLPDGNPEHNVLPAPDAEPYMVFNFGPHPQYRVSAP